MNAFDFSRVIFKSIDFPHWVDVDIARLGSILRIKQHFTYKYGFTTQNRGVHKGEGGQFGEKKERKEQTLNLSLLQAAAAAPFPSDFFSFFLSPSRWPTPTSLLPSATTPTFQLHPHGPRASAPQTTSWSLFPPYHCPPPLTKTVAFSFIFSKTQSPSPHQNQPPTLPPLLFSPQILPLSSSLYPPRPSFPPAPPHLAKQNSCSNPGLEFFGLHTVAPSPSSSRETNKPNSGHCSSIVQVVPEAFLCNSWSFRFYFVNFKLLT